MVVVEHLDLQGEEYVNAMEGTIDLKKVVLNRLVSRTVLRRHLASKSKAVMSVSCFGPRFCANFQF